VRKSTAPGAPELFELSRAELLDTIWQAICENPLLDEVSFAR
jgi:hypothetical protein